MTDDEKDWLLAHREVAAILNRSLANSAAGALLSPSKWLTPKHEPGAKIIEWYCSTCGRRYTEQGKGSCTHEYCPAAIRAKVAHDAWDAVKEFVDRRSALRGGQEGKVPKSESVPPVPGPGSGAGMLPGQRCTRRFDHEPATSHSFHPYADVAWSNADNAFQRCPYVQPNPGSGMKPPPASPCAEWCGTDILSHDHRHHGESPWMSNDEPPRCYCDEPCLRAGRPLSPPTPERKP